MNLQDLPAEILDEITLYLPYTSLIALRWTSRTLYNDIYCPLPPHWLTYQQYHNPAARLLARDARFPFRTLDGKIDCDEQSVLRRNPAPEQETTFTTKATHVDDLRRAHIEVAAPPSPRRPTPGELRRCMFDLLILESYPCFNTSALSRIDDLPQDYLPKTIPLERYACHICLKLLPQSHFAPKETRGDCTRGRTPITILLERQAKTSYYDSFLPLENRYCLSCGTKEGKYAKGALLQFIGEEYVVTGKPGECGARKLVVGVGIVCKRCGEWKVCEEGMESKSAIRRLCKGCLAYRPLFGLSTKVAY